MLTLPTQQLSNIATTGQNLQHTNTDPSPQDILHVYIASQGIVSLCLERLNKQYYPDYDAIKNPSANHIDETKLYTQLTQPSLSKTLQERTRAQLTLSTFVAASEALSALRLKMSMLEPGDTVRAATQLIAQLQELTAPPKSDTFNANTFIWENLIPQEAVDAINFLKQPQANQQQSQQQPTPQHAETAPKVIDHIGP